MRPCGHNNILEPGKPYEVGQCRVCWHYYNTPAYRDLWDKGESANASRFPKQQPQPNPKRCQCGKPH